MEKLKVELETIKMNLENSLEKFQAEYKDDVLHEIGTDDPMDLFQLGCDKGNLQGQLLLIDMLLKNKL